LRSHEHLFIGGGWVSPATAERIEVRSPATEELIGQVPSGSPADIDAEVLATTEIGTGG